MGGIKILCQQFTRNPLTGFLTRSGSLWANHLVRRGICAKIGFMPKLETSGKEKAELPVFVGQSWADHVRAWHTITKEIEDRQWQLGAIAESLSRLHGEQSIERFAVEVR